MRVAESGCRGRTQAQAGHGGQADAHHACCSLCCCVPWNAGGYVRCRAPAMPHGRWWMGQEGRIRTARGGGMSTKILVRSRSRAPFNSGQRQRVLSALWFFSPRFARELPRAYDSSGRGARINIPRGISCGNLSA